MAAAATSTIDAYERLRAAVLHAEPLPGPDLGTVRRRGLAAWLKGLIVQAPVELARATPDSTPNTTGDPAPAASEHTRVIAEILIALVAEPAVARQSGCERVVDPGPARSIDNLGRAIAVHRFAMVSRDR